MTGTDRCTQKSWLRRTSRFRPSEDEYWGAILKGTTAHVSWTDWVTEVSNLSPDRSISFYPFLWAEADSLDSRHRGSVPVQEAFNLQFEMARQLNGRPT